MSSYAHRMYEDYARARPGCIAPVTPADLLRRQLPTFEKRLARFLPPSKDAAILDVGCGYGEFLYFLQERGYRDTTGIDLNAQQVQTARRLGVRNVVCGAAAEFLSESDRQFDFISMLDVLEHVPKDEVLPLLALIHGALRPGGSFVCQVPNLAAFFTPLFYMDFSHETPFTATSLKQVLELAGFQSPHVFPMGPVAHGLVSATRVLLWKIITACLRGVQTIEGGSRNPLSSIYSAAILGVVEKDRVGWRI